MSMYFGPLFECKVLQTWILPLIRIVHVAQVVARKSHCKYNEGKKTEPDVSQETLGLLYAPLGALEQVTLGL